MTDFVMKIANLRTMPIEEAGLELLRRGYAMREMMLYRYDDDLDVLTCRGQVIVSVQAVSEPPHIFIDVRGPSYPPHRPLWLERPVGEC